VELPPVNLIKDKVNGKFVEQTGTLKKFHIHLQTLSENIQKFATKDKKFE
jgi:hypothetical protein